MMFCCWRGGDLKLFAAPHVVASAPRPVLCSEPARRALAPSVCVHSRQRLGSSSAVDACGGMPSSASTCKAGRGWDTRCLAVRVCRVLYPEHEAWYMCLQRTLLI